MANPWDQYSNEFTTPQPPTGPFATLVPQAASQYGVPEPVLNWVGYRENAWKPTGAGIPTSTGKAQGAWQFMPQTAQSMGVDPNDPASSTFGAAKYLRSLYDQTGSWTEAVRKYGTFSSGQGATRDHALESGFMTHMLNSGLNPDTAPPTGPVQVSDHPIVNVPQGQATDASTLLSGFQNKAAPMPDPTTPSAMAQQAPGDTGMFSKANLLRIAAGFAGKKTFGQGLSAAAQGAADGMLQDQQMAMLRQQRSMDQQRIGIQQQQVGIQQQQANTAEADGRARVIENAGHLAELGVPPQQALQAAMAAYNGPGGSAQSSQAPAMSPTGAPPAPPAVPGSPGLLSRLGSALGIGGGSGPAQASPSGLPPGLATPAPSPGTTASPLPPPAPSGGGGLPPGLSPVATPSATPNPPPITGAGPGTPQPLPPGLSGPAGGSTAAAATATPPGGQVAPKAPLWPGMPDLSGTNSTGGRSTAGDLFYGTDGSAYQERNHPFGPPTYFNTNTGQMSPTLPQGAMRAQDSYMKQLNQADGAAQNAAASDALGSQKQLALLNTYQELIPQIASGNDLWSTIKRNAAQITGMQIGDADPTAIQLAQQAQQTLAQSRIMMLGHQGLGRVNVQEVNAVKNAGANWAQNPQALNIVLNYAKQQEQMKQNLWDEWNQAAPTDKAQGFRAFQYNFQKNNKTPEMDTSSVTGQPGAGASSVQPPAPSSAPASAPSSAQANRPPLSKFGF